MSERASWQSTVADLFDSFGDVIVSATLKRVSSAYNPATGGTTDTTATSSCRLLFDQASASTSQYIAGTEILPTDKPIWMQGSSFAPVAGDLLSISGRPDMTVVFSNNLVELDAIYLVVGR